MSDISPATIYFRLKRLLARIKKKQPSDILAEHTLRGNLRFTEAGVKGLAVHINEEFKDLKVKFTPDQISKAKTVRDLFGIIKAKIDKKAEAKVKTKGKIKNKTKTKGKTKTKAKRKNN